MPHDMQHEPDMKRAPMKPADTAHESVAILYPVWPLRWPPCRVLRKSVANMAVLDMLSVGTVRELTTVAGMGARASVAGAAVLVARGGLRSLATPRET